MITGLGSVAFRCVLFVSILAAVICIINPVEADMKRLVWSYNGGFFLDQGNGNWIEKNPTGKYHFREADRNAEFIELYDGSRPCTVRLYEDAMYIKGGVYSDFTKLYDGEWTK